MAKNDKLPGGIGFRYAADLYYSLNPGSKEFSGNSRTAHKIYPVLQRAYMLGLQHGSLADEKERRRIQRLIGKGNT